MQQTSSRSGWLVAGILFAIGSWVAIAATGLFFDSHNRPLNGLKLGLTYGQATLAGCWMVLGGGATRPRLVWSIGWLFVLCVAWVTHRIDAGIIWASIGLQWLLVVVALVPLRVVRGIRIRPSAELETFDPARQQFGIGQLMALTGLVALLLGIGRVLLPLLAKAGKSGEWGEGPVFCFVVATNVVLTLPLALAGLLPRYWLWACAAAIIFIALATIGEVSLIPLFLAGDGHLDPEVLVLFLLMNGSQAASVIGALALARAASYWLG